MKYQHMRPRVDEVVPCEPQEVVARIQAHLRRVQGCPYEGQMGGTHLCLKMCDREREFWSPWLDCHIEPHDGGARIYGRLTPHPSVWTGFMAGYAFLAFVALVALAYGYTQWTMGHAPWALVGVPVALALAGMLYLGAFFGQRLSEDQMHKLRAFLDDALAQPSDS